MSMKRWPSGGDTNQQQYGKVNPGNQRSQVMYAKLDASR